MERLQVRVQPRPARTALNTPVSQVPGDARHHDVACVLDRESAPEYTGPHNRDVRTRTSTRYFRVFHPGPIRSK
jgi:hypothetical protein